MSRAFLNTFGTFLLRGGRLVTDLLVLVVLHHLAVEAQPARELLLAQAHDHLSQDA